jgi:exosome complex component RRP42
MFSDDWDAAPPLYPASSSLRPPITLLVVAVKNSVIFDPSKEEIAVADTILAISLSAPAGRSDAKGLQILGLRTIDPPSRLTTPGLADSDNTATSTVQEGSQSAQTPKKSDGETQEGVWRAPRGGFKKGLVSKVLAMCLESGGVGEEVLAGLEGFKA